jgi:polyisoprenoid-binding protein YceI
MMVTFVRGHFKNVHGTLTFDAGDPTRSSMTVRIDAAGLWSGEPQRDAHLRSPDFLDVEKHPHITFESTRVTRVAGNDYKVEGNLTIRGVTREVTLDVRFQGEWRTPYGEKEVTRAGFHATTTIDRHAFGVSWNSPMANGGVVVGNDVMITLDAEAVMGTEGEYD